MNAIELLISEHNSHRKLLDLIDSNDRNFQNFRDEFIHHVDIEEAVFYPGLIKIPDLELLVREAWEEHSLCMQLLQEMDQPDISEKMWLSKFAVLKKLVLTHIDDEEKELFPKITSFASPELLESLGELMLVQKQNLSPDKILYPEEPGLHKLDS